MADLEFWFDFAAPTPIWRRRHRAGRRRGGRAGDLEAVPAGPDFQRAGLDRFALQPLPGRGRYLWLDLQRETRRLGIAWRRPARFPFNSTLATKTATWIDTGFRLPAYCRAVFRAGFAERRDPATPTVIEECLRQAGLDARPWSGRWRKAAGSAPAPM